MVKGPVDIGDLSPRRYFAGVALVLGLLFAFIAGDGESPGRLLRGFLQWQLQSWVPMALLLLSHMLWSRSRWFERAGPWGQLLLSGVTGSLLFAPLALLMDVYLFGDGERFAAGEVLGEFWNLWPPVTLTWMAINTPFILGLRLRGGESPRDGDGDSDGASGESSGAVLPNPERAPAAPDFMGLVPASLRGPVLYMQAELHYLAVVTDRGRCLILYNLRDAMDELPKQEGLLTHRSFAVVLDQVRDFRRRGRQGVLIMSNGDEVPVSRRRLAAVEEALRKKQSGPF